MNEELDESTEASDNPIMRELEIARREISQTRRQEAQERLEINEAKEGYLAGLEDGAEHLKERLQAQHDDRNRQIESLKRRLDECVASGDNEGMMAILSEIAQLESNA